MSSSQCSGTSFASSHARTSEKWDSKVTRYSAEDDWFNFINWNIAALKLRIEICRLRNCDLKVFIQQLTVLADKQNKSQIGGRYLDTWLRFGTTTPLSRHKLSQLYSACERGGAAERHYMNRGGGKKNESTHVILLWVSTGERQRPHHDPFFLLKRFHQEDSPLLGPAVETRGGKSSGATKQKVEQQLLHWRGGTMDVLSELNTEAAKRWHSWAQEAFLLPLDRKTKLNKLWNSWQDDNLIHRCSFPRYRAHWIIKWTVIK